MTILGIDTSCDDTCICVLEVKKKKVNIISNVVSSQVKLHAKYGGVYPFLAKREHQKNLPTVLKKALRQTQDKQIDLIGVTAGPGLEPCLWQGVNFAKDLAEKLKVPVVPVNHIEAHVLANFLNSKYYIQNTKYLFPAVCLVVSGGHTQLILMKGIGQYKLIGETRDDAAGECFDKAARILGLGYPGGPQIATKAAKCKIQNTRYKIQLPRPMIYQKNYDFSFSGLKTAVLYNFRSQVPEVRKSKDYIREMCKEIQQAIIDVLIRKTIRAAKDFRVKSIILGGGVVANDELRKQLKEKVEKEIPNTKYLIPDTEYCTDNAAMIALTAYFHKNKTKSTNRIKADANLKI
jgi:N6-L-threonylcarbamoyladenine synthase